MSSSSSSSGGGSTGGGIGGSTGGLPSSSSIQDKINAGGHTIAEMKALVKQLREAIERERIAAEEAANNTPPEETGGGTGGETGGGDDPNQPGETPGGDPTDGGNNIPANDGSGIRHEFETGYSYEFSPNGDGTYNVYTYDPAGNQFSSYKSTDLTNIPEGQTIQGIIEGLYTDELNQSRPGWDDTTSEHFKQSYPEQYTGPDLIETETGGEDQVADPLEGVTYTAPDGSTIDFSVGNTNQGYVELDNQIDQLIDSYQNAEDGEEKESALSKLNQADENLTKFSENMAEYAEKVNKEFQKEQAILDDLESVANSASSTEQEKIEANRLIPLQQHKLNKLQDGYSRVNNLVADINQETAKDLADVLDGEKTEDDFLADSKEVLQWSVTGLTALALGTTLYETWYGGDDVDGSAAKSATETMAEANAAIEANLPKALELQEQFQPQIDNLENKSNFNKIFGTDPAAEFFNSDPKWQTEYDSYLLGPDGIAGTGDEPESPLSKSQWLEQWMEQNPESADALAYRDSYSRIGTQEKLLDRNMQNAKNLYTPEELGGMGYTPDDFRTADQRKTMKLANELIDSPLNAALEDSVMSELGKGGDMGDAYYGNMRNNILGGLAPSLAKQGGLLSGGVQRLAREMTGDYQRTLQSRQNAAQGYLNQRGNQLTNFSNLANANTVSPSSVYGLPSGSQLVGNQYAQAAAPTGSQLLSDPTSAFASSLGQQNLLNSFLNQANQQSTTEKLNNTINVGNNLLDLIEKGEQIGQD